VDSRRAGVATHEVLAAGQFIEKSVALEPHRDLERSAQSNAGCFPPSAIMKEQGRNNETS
jgi:hypothetical protein